MNKNKVIKVIPASQLPVRCPYAFSILVFLALDHWMAPGWVYGCFSTLLALMWIGWAYRLCHERDVPLKELAD